jgi:hypothetical protein
MSRTTTHAPAAAASVGQAPRGPAELAAEVATVLAGMSYTERVRAYRSGALSARELAVAAAWLPEAMPMLNDEFEWIAISLADLE